MCVCVSDDSEVLIKNTLVKSPHSSHSDKYCMIIP